MLVTETQAAEKWCPMVRIARHETITIEGSPVGDMTPYREEHHIVGGCNTDALGGLRVPASCRCIGSRCMMWEWAEMPEQRFKVCPIDRATIEPPALGGPPASWEWRPYDAQEGEPAGWLEPENEAAARRRGHCGLKSAA